MAPPLNQMYINDMKRHLEAYKDDSQFTLAENPLIVDMFFERIEWLIADGNNQQVNEFYSIFADILANHLMTRPEDTPIFQKLCQLGKITIGPSQYPLMTCSG